jgi:hypothetical protein
MSTRKLFEMRIGSTINIPNSNGYVNSYTDNLIDGVEPSLFYADLNQGSGNELQGKFRAIYSSSALAVNNFAIVKQYQYKFSFLGHSGFKNVQFERKFPTGLNGTPPNLDFAIENDETVIGFESKYLEPLELKLAKFSGSYLKSTLFNSFWKSLFHKYNNSQGHLDTAQLIKHSLGLINNSKTENKKAILVYIYWTPVNRKVYREYNIHERELMHFIQELNQQSDIEFVSLSYEEFWNKYSQDAIFNDHFKKVRTRYEITI